MRIFDFKSQTSDSGFQIFNFKSQSLNSRLAFATVLLFYLAFLPDARAQIASGGNFVLEKSVVASGGATISAGGNFAVGGSIGQPAVGTQPVNAPFALQPGFWTAAPLAPTAAAVSLGGRVMTADGRGIRNVRIALTMPDGETRYALSSAFGYYRFTDVQAGATYVLTAHAKRYVFAVPTQIVNLNEERDDVDFVALN